jgi:DNA-binding transcriptional MerR regulator
MSSDTDTKPDADADAKDADTSVDGADDTSEDDDGADDLADAGKQALDRMKSQRNAARDQLREFKALGLSPAQIKALADKKPADDADKVDPEAIREQARTEARAEAAKERVVDKIEAKASRKFADAEDAVAILLRTHDTEDFLDDGKVDVEAIQEALDELLEKKPHLAVQDGKRFKGDPDGGTRKAARPGQLTRDDLKRMSPQEITKAKADGRLADLLGTK